MDKKKKIILVSVILGAAILVAFLLFGSSTQQDAQNKEAAPGAGGAGAEETNTSGSLASLLANATTSTNPGLASSLGLEADTVTGLLKAAKVNVPDFGLVKIYKTEADIFNSTAAAGMYVLPNGEKLLPGTPKFDQVAAAIAGMGKIKISVV